MLFEVVNCYNINFIYQKSKDNNVTTVTVMAVTLKMAAIGIGYLYQYFNNRTSEFNQLVL